jgi:flavodoxin
LKKILVVYYSLFGTTELAAEYLAEKVKADLLKLIPEKDYSFDYNTAVKEARLDIEKEFCPKLINKEIDIGQYDMIFVGGPNWFKCFPPPIISFLKNNSKKFKTVIPFCTHGGGGLGKMEMQIQQKCLNVTLINGIAISPDTITENIDSWLEVNGTILK